MTVALVPRAVLPVTLIGTVAATWLFLATLWFAGGHHHGVEPSFNGGLWAQFLVFSAGWVVMSVAMMLPAASPFFRDVSGRFGTGALLFFCVLGYLAVWWLVSIPAFLVAAGIESTISNPAVVVVAVVSLAAVYQVTPMKRRFLGECGCVVNESLGVATLASAARLGARYGRLCFGCCWALMLIMVVAGSAGLWLMAVLTIAMVAERVLYSLRFSDTASSSSRARRPMFL